MVNDNNFNSQRRNLMIINVILFLVIISNIDITQFKILGVLYEIKEDSFLFKNYNNLLLTIWIYFNIRYISTLLYEIRNKLISFKNYNKVGILIEQEMRVAKTLLNDNSIISRLFGRYFVVFFFFIKILFKIFILLFHKNIIDYIVPIIFSAIIVFLYLPMIWSSVIVIIMFMFIGMSIDASRVNLKETKYTNKKYYKYK